MTSRSTLTLAASAVAVLLALVLVVPRSIQRNATRSTLGVLPASSAEDLATTIDVPVDVEASTPREHVLAGEIEAEGDGYRVTVLDETGAPVFGAEAWVGGRDGKRVSDAAGVLRFSEAGVAGRVIADGFLPKRLTVSDEPQELRLERDPGLALALRWEDGEPVVGARVEAVFPDPHLDPARVARVAVPTVPTDAEGRTVVGPYRIGRDTAHLRVDPPGAARTWLHLPGDLDRSGRATFEARLERGASGHRVRVVDAEGRPLADRAVTYRVLVEDVARTDADGWADFGAQAIGPAYELPGGASYSASYVVELEPDRSWWFEHAPAGPRAEHERTLRVAHRRVFGRVESPAPASYLVATAATPFVPQDRSRELHAAFDALAWQTVKADGSFEILHGWQGPRTMVLLRHREHAKALWKEVVPDSGGPVVLEAPDVCRVTIESKRRARKVGRVFFDRDEAPQGYREVRVSFGDGFPMPDERGIGFDLPDVPDSIEVPRGRYSVCGKVEGNQWLLEDLDASGPTATLDLDVPALVHVRGRISGSLRGPLARFAVSLHSESTTTVQQTFTDRAGWFEAQVLAHGAIHVFHSGNDKFESLGMSVDRRLEPALDAAHPVAQYEIAEALLRIIERPPSPLLRFKTLWIDAVTTSGERLPGKIAIDLDAGGRAELHVPPGTYRLSRRFDAEQAQDVLVTVEANGEHEVVLDSAPFAALSISVTVGDPQQRELRWLARDAHGSLAALDIARKLRGDAHDFVKVVEPGTYSMEIQSRLRGARSGEPPLDVWRGELTAVPGAQAPLRIHLR